jgi:outer membrane protein insertion porin family
LRPLLFVLLVCSIYILPQRSDAQRTKAPTYKILGISVEGNDPKNGTETAAIINNTGLKVGDEIAIPGDQTRSAIQRLWALKIFSDVELLIDNKVSDGVYLLVKVTELPRLDKVEVTGADDVSKDDVLKKINITPGQVITPSDVKKFEQSIKDLYFDEGHLLVTIKTEETPVSDTAKGNKVVLTFKIDEGPSVTIEHVHAAGQIAFSEDDVKGAMDDTHEKSWWQIFSHPHFDRKKFEDDKRKIVKFYHSHGYLDAEVVSDSEWYRADKKHIDVLVNVHEGVQYKIRSISWAGNTVYRPEQLTAVLGFKPGDVYDEGRFDENLHGNSDQNDVSSLYLDNGYLKFNIEPEISRNGTDSLDIIVHVYESNKFQIGKVDIKGNTKTKDFVIRRELYTRPGDYFNRSAIIRSLRQLGQLNYFNPEKLKPDVKPEDDNKTVDLTYEVEEKSSDNVNASVGYSQAFGVTGALGFTIANFSLADPLEGGAGQIFSFQWQFGEGAVYRTFSLGFTEPWLYGTPTTLGVNLFDTREQYVYDLEQTGISARIGRGHLKWIDDLMRVDYTVTLERNDVRNTGGSPYYRVGLTTEFSIAQAISRNSTDSPIFPTSGSINSFSVSVSGGPLGIGNVDYHKWLLSSEWFTPLFGSTRVVLYGLTSFGYLDAFKVDSTIPPIQFFRMGGTGLGLIATVPLRGYDDQSIGPLDENHVLLPARVMTKETVELRGALTLNPIPIYILAFAEGGNVYQDFYRTDLFDLKRSIGVGARIMINPIGMVGFDEAYGLDSVWPNLTSPSGWHFHFQFGKGF